MKFSLLTLNLHTYQEPDQDEKFERIARFAMQENITCLCFQECAQSTTASYLDKSETVREDNAAHVIVRKLNDLGQKYGYVWDWAHIGFDVYEEGLAVVSQLPVLASTSELVSAGDDPTDAMGTRKVLHARLAVNTEMVIDVYSMHLSDPGHGGEEQVRALTGFVGRTPDLLREAAPPKQKRRGHLKLMSQEQIQRDPFRVVFVAGDLNDPPGGPMAAAMQRAGFADPSQSLRDDGAGTFQDGRWIDYVFMKPLLKPTAGRVAFDGVAEPTVSDHMGVFLEFEV